MYKFKCANIKIFVPHATDTRFFDYSAKNTPIVGRPYRKSLPLLTYKIWIVAWSLGKKILKPVKIFLLDSFEKYIPLLCVYIDRDLPCWSAVLRKNLLFRCNLYIFSICLLLAEAEKVQINPIENINIKT